MTATASVVETLLAPDIDAAALAVEERPEYEAFR